MEQYVQKKSRGNLNFQMPVSNVNSEIGETGIGSQKTWERIQPIQFRRNKVAELPDSQRVEAESQNGLIQRCITSNVVQFDGFLGKRPANPAGGDWGGKVHGEPSGKNYQRDHIIPHSLIRAYVNKLYEMENEDKENRTKEEKEKINKERYGWIIEAIISSFQQAGKTDLSWNGTTYAKEESPVYLGEGLSGYEDIDVISTLDEIMIKGLRGISNGKMKDIINNAVSWMSGNIALNEKGTRIMDHTDESIKVVNEHIEKQKGTAPNTGIASNTEIEQILTKAERKSEIDKWNQEFYHKSGIEGLDYELLHLVYDEKVRSGVKEDDAFRFALMYQEAFNNMQEVAYGDGITDANNKINSVSQILSEIAQVKKPFNLDQMNKKVEDGEEQSYTVLYPMSEGVMRYIAPKMLNERLQTQIESNFETMMGKKKADKEERQRLTGTTTKKRKKKKKDKETKGEV
ncbi:hypothetical protein [[Clostridium] polysaccharolyticum]|uniref:Uncharacterized protein n=1 Tax=[Clostridium] polysaccharolyticum TaxID=29364 RepID=A0A1H9YUI0_9FIRM|nr:hypothetical protein [[Clostridium] polysaccharolyticum]SES72830.1 hypothetical protein SAMN04487772_102206 [[Clostridium] polysaccharolyticum]